jgi:hypothetical protein
MGDVSMMSAAIAGEASGRSEDARRVLNELLARSRTHMFPPTPLEDLVALGDAKQPL